MRLKSGPGSRTKGARSGRVDVMYSSITDKEYANRIFSYTLISILTTSKALAATQGNPTAKPALNGPKLRR